MPHVSARILRAPHIFAIILCLSLSDNDLEVMNMAENITFFTNGSRWVRADFHLHTKQDKEFKDTGSDQDFIVGLSLIHI